jgi:thiopeptide-type bacteriocin biosynthesis protein
MVAAEQVFVADSFAVLTQLRRIPDNAAQPAALAAANLVDIACAFCGGTEAGMAWLIGRGAGDRPAPAAREVLAQAVALGDPDSDLAALRGLPGGEALTAHRIRRREALEDYRRLLPDTMDRDEVLESLLHMHHVRAMGIDRDRERMCRRLARAVALGWRAQRGTR